MSYLTEKTQQLKAYDKKATFNHQNERNRKPYPRTRNGLKGYDKKPAFTHENERNRKLYPRTRNGLKGSDCQYFLAFRISTNESLIHELRKVQDDYLAQDMSLSPLLESLEKAHIALNIIHCDQTRVKDLKKVIGEIVENNREKLANPPIMELKGLRADTACRCLCSPLALQVECHEVGRKYSSWFEDVYRIFQNTLNENGFETLDHDFVQDVSLFRAKVGHELKLNKKDLGPFGNYGNTIFGTLTMGELDFLLLCCMKSTAPASIDGFYNIEETYVLNK